MADQFLGERRFKADGRVDDAAHPVRHTENAADAALVAADARSHLLCSTRAGLANELGVCDERSHESHEIGDALPQYLLAVSSVRSRPHTMRGMRDAAAAIGALEGSIDAVGSDIEGSMAGME